MTHRVVIWTLVGLLVGVALGFGFRTPIASVLNLNAEEALPTSATTAINTPSSGGTFNARAALLSLINQDCPTAAQNTSATSIVEALNTLRFAQKVGDLTEEQGVIDSILQQNGIDGLDSGCTKVRLTGWIDIREYAKGDSDQYPPKFPADLWFTMSYSLTATITWLDKDCKTHTTTIHNSDDTGWTHVITDNQGKSISTQHQDGPPDLTGYTLIIQLHRIDIDETRGSIDNCPHCKKPPTATGVNAAL